MATVPLTRPQETSTDTGTRASWLARHPLLAYSALAYGLSWLILVPAGLGLLPDSAGGILSWLAPFGPAAAAFLVAALTGGRPAVGQLLRRLGRWRVGAHWYLLVLAGIPLLQLLGAFAVLGTVPLGELARNWPAYFTTYLPSVVYVFLFTGLGEEPGWRGFALPRLQERHGPLLGTAILGVVWTLWHLPNLLFGGYTGVSYALWVVVTLATTVIYTWVYNRTGGSILIAALLHGAINSGKGVLGPQGLLPGFADALLVHKDALLALAFTAAALVLLAATRGRLGYRPEGATPASTLPQESDSAAPRA
jgi:membrane protease YdiL (CAAX protease family)